jgi:hypothetical protein
MPKDQLDILHSNLLEGIFSIYSFNQSYKLIHDTISENGQRFLDQAGDIKEKIKKEESNRDYVEVIELVSGQNDDNPAQIKRDLFENALLLTKLEIRVMSNYPQIIKVMSFIYVVALFDSYILDMIKFSLLKRSEVILSLSKKELKYEEIFKFNNMQDLQSYVVDKEIINLGYGSTRDKFEFMEKNLKINFDEYVTHIEKLNEIYETRHLWVHNKGIVNQKYIKAISDPKFKPDETRTVTDEYLDDSIETILIISEYLKNSFSKFL